MNMLSSFAHSHVPSVFHSSSEYKGIFNIPSWFYSFKIFRLQKGNKDIKKNNPNESSSLIRVFWRDIIALYYEEM